MKYLIVSATDVSSISTRGNYIFIIFIFSVWWRGKARRWVPPLNIQQITNSAEREEEIVLAQGSVVPSTYPAERGIDRKVTKEKLNIKFYKLILLKYRSSISYS